jgi:hypothetical protein
MNQRHYLRCLAGDAPSRPVHGDPADARGVAEQSPCSRGGQACLSAVVLRLAYMISTRIAPHLAQDEQAMPKAPRVSPAPAREPHLARQEARRRQHGSSVPPSPRELVINTQQILGDPAFR